jgi:hypothetical protein
LNEEKSYAELVEAGRLLFSVPRRDVRKWSAYIDREAELRPGATRVQVMREHLAALNEKAGTMTGVAGVLAAGCALLGNLLFGAGPRVDPLTTGLFVLLAAASLASVVYAMSSLGVEQPEDAGQRGAAAFEFRLLQRLVYRARNHGWALRSSQIAALAATLLLTAGARLL